MDRMTDLINVRYASRHRAEQEYAVVFPQYFFGQIFEARHEPGTTAYSARLQLDQLQETIDRGPVDGPSSCDWQRAADWIQTCDSFGGMGSPIGVWHGGQARQEFEMRKWCGMWEMRV